MSPFRWMKSTVLLGLGLCVMALLAGCEDGPPKGSTLAAGSSAGTDARLNETGSDNLDDAEWGEIDFTRVGRQPRGGTASSSQQGSGPGHAAAMSEARPWTIVLATVTGENVNQHQVANNALIKIRELAPELAGARVIESKSGLIIGYGAYADVRDAQAQRDLERVKSLTVRGAQPFNAAVLTRVNSDSRAATAGRLHPHDLRSARKLFPDVDPMYTLQVGVWSDFESGQLKPEQVRTNAEKQAAELRTHGFDAYFYHDVERTISIVTVGLFDSTALKMDKQLHTPVLSEEVEMLLHKFPAHLVNGAPMEEPISRNKPSLGTRQQTCKLVLVP